MRSATRHQSFAQRFQKREPTHAAAHDFSHFSASSPFRLDSACAGPDPADKAKYADPGARHERNDGLLGDGSIILRRGRGEDSADRDGIVAPGGESAAADG